MKVTKNITIDLNNPRRHVIHLMESGNQREIILTLLKDGMPFDVSDGIGTATLVKGVGYIKANGVPGYYDWTSTDLVAVEAVTGSTNKWTVRLDEHATDVSGFAQIFVKFSLASGETLYSFPITLDVIRTSGGTTDPDKPYYHSSSFVLVGAQTQKTSAMTQPVGIDGNGKLWVMAGGSGQPIPVYIADEMSEHDQIYLYLGDEEGYDYGYVYVHNGSAWEATTLYGIGSSPSASVSKSGTTTTITITDADGTTTAEVEDGSATDAQVNSAVSGWLDDHPEATTTVQDGSVTDAKLVQSGGVLDRVNNIKDVALEKKLASSDFQRGYWSGSSIASSTTRICSKTLIPVLAGDLLTIDEQSIYIGAWLYVDGDTSADATELLGYTDPKPQYYTIPQSGLLVIQGRKHTSSATLQAADFIGSVTIQHKIVRDVSNNTTIVDIVEEKGFTRRELGQSQFAQGYWSGGSIVSSYTRICSKEWYSLNSGDSIIYQSNVAELGIWAQGDSDAEPVNIVPYAPSIQKTKITFSEHTLVMFQLKATTGNISPSNFDARITIQRFGNAYDGLEELYLGEMIQANGAADGITSSTTRVVMKSVLALPYGDRTQLTVKVNYGFKVGVRVGSSPYNLNDNLYWFYDGDTISLPAGSNFYRLGIAKLGDTTITVDDLADADLHVFYEPHDSSFAPFDGAANACLLDVPTGPSNMNYRTLPSFLHTSDVHGDYVRVKRFAEVAERLGVSMATITGDIVPYNTFPNCNHFEWLHEIIKDSSVLWGLCVGNHDSHVGNGSSSYTMSDADVYTNFYDPIKTEIGNATEKVWYVKDMTTEKIRVISLDLYQYGGVWTKTFFTQEQLTWLCTTLAATPQGYGVVILMHAQQLSVVKDDNYAKFFQTVRKGETAEYYNAVDNDGDPIGDIVDAFIKKTTISKTYTQNSGADTLNVSGDFSSVASGVEFICYMTGHFHQDTIGYAPRPVGDPKQLVLNVTCGCSAYGGSSYKYLADCSDTPRNQMDATQDAFNVYGIDRATKTVRVARVGSNINHLLAVRDFMSIPYAT